MTVQITVQRAAILAPLLYAAHAERSIIALRRLLACNLDSSRPSAKRSIVTHLSQATGNESA